MAYRFESCPDYLYLKKEVMKLKTTLFDVFYYLVVGFSSLIILLWIILFILKGIVSLI